MEHLGAAYSVAQSLYEAVQNPALQEMCSVWGYESELESLQGTVDTIKAVIHDAESKQDRGDVLSHQVQLWAEQLKDALYDADDLLDTFITLAQQKQLRSKEEGLFEKVRRYFSFDNPLVVAYNMSRDVREVRYKLDSIAESHNKFGFKIECQCIHKRREETYSYVYEPDIIGRDDDLDKIVGRLVDPAVSCLSIVGIGGLGKTTLAQLVYNDSRIEQAFPLRWWTCISDEGSLELKVVLSKILESIMGYRDESPSIDNLQRKLREQIVGKKYLLVLDDVWSEDRAQWIELMTFFKGSLAGSSILVTTRSRMTATIVEGEIYDLKGLSHRHSWLLFEKTAFAKDQEENNRPELDQIGREIVKKCANVPLAVKVVGSALYAQGKRVWLSFRDVALVKINGQDGIGPILKLSYLNLNPQLKICFSYCAMFPKNYSIYKVELIELWIAQGYVVPLHNGQSVEDIAEQYFLTLLRRCFFQDVVRDKLNGEIVSFKMHDLMHDIANEVAGKEVPEYNFVSSKLDYNRILHLMHHDSGSAGTRSPFVGTKIRTYLRVGHSYLESPMALGSFLDNWISLRALDLSSSKMRSLPSTLGKLLHLRYLDLSWNVELKVLPNSITKLHNLQFLHVAHCSMLKQLPKDLGKLTNLRVLDTVGCYSLTHMPRGIGKLSSLWKLPYFVLGEGTSGKEKGQLAHQPQEIKALQSLKGSFEVQIHIPKDAKYVVETVSERRCLSQHLTDILITFPDKRDFSKMGTRIYEVEEELLEDLLQPHHNSNLKELELAWYCGSRMPNWARQDNLAILLPNLVKVKLEKCHKLQQIGILGTLPKLKSLELEYMDNLEYIENTRKGKATFDSQQSLFFPSLERLELLHLPKLKGWWREERNSNQTDGGLITLPSFPRLSRLLIRECPNLGSMPLCPTVEELGLKIENANLSLTVEQITESRNSEWKAVSSNSVGFLKFALQMNALQCLSRLLMYWDDKVEILSEVEEMFRSCSSSLRELEIWACLKLKSVMGGLEHLTDLEELKLVELPNLSLSKGEREHATHDDDDDDDGMPWHSLQHSLRCLELRYLPKVVKLPNGMRHLTALQSLVIKECYQLEAIPEWMPELTSLKQLHIDYCSDALYERCCQDTGEDWLKIHHIPDFLIEHPMREARPSIQTFLRVCPPLSCIFFYPSSSFIN